MEHFEVGGQVLRVVLHGRLDSRGVDRIEQAFTALLAGSDRQVMVDLRDVGFVATMAIRMFIANARSLQQGGRRMVLFGARPLVGEVFEHVALSDLIPIVATESSALACAVQDHRER